jgi:hypothetical protein
MCNSDAMALKNQKISKGAAGWVFPYPGVS